MNIKSLLLGSAAVLIAASTAQAADAIVVEPEPVEYVRICDAYGNGFFYIPGTETCMRLSGYVRSTYDHYTETTGGVEDPDHASWSYRGRLNIDVRNETDWGVLRSQLRLQGDGGGSGDANVGVDRALISVAGFRVGYSDTYWTTAHAYGQGPAVNDGFFNYDQALFFDYTYAVDGFSLTVGVQDSSGTAADQEDPDLYIGAKYAGSWGWAAATYMYDQNGTNNGTGLTSGADAWKASVEFTNVGDSGWNIGGWYMADGDDDTQYVTGVGTRNALATGLWTDSQWGVQANGSLADNLVGYVTYSSVDADSSAGAVAAGYLGADQVAVGIVWTPITGLAIQAEYHQIDVDYTAAANDTDTDGFLVRIVRSW